MYRSLCEYVFSNLIDVFLGGASGEESACQCRRHGFDPWVWKIPWSSKWQPTLIFLPGKSHGQWSLAGYSPLGHRELDTRSKHTYNLIGGKELPSSYGNLGTTHLFSQQLCYFTLHWQCIRIAISLYPHHHLLLSAIIFNSHYEVVLFWLTFP